MATDGDPSPGLVGSLGSLLKRLGRLLWVWGPYAKNSHRPDDSLFFSVCQIPVKDASIRGLVAQEFSDLPPSQLPIDEEALRRLIRERFPPPDPEGDHTAEWVTFYEGANSAQERERKRKKIFEQTAEEAWPHVPESLCRVLAALNVNNLRTKLVDISNQQYHTVTGAKRIQRSRDGIFKALNIWRDSFSVAVSRKEKIWINIFFVFLIYNGISPDLYGGLLGERAYNERSIGNKIVTFFQLYFLWTFPYSILWLLFSWSLERAFGGLVGITIYGLAVMFPRIRHHTQDNWFRIMSIVLTIIWQIGVQFFFPVRDLVERFITRVEMRTFRARTDKRAGRGQDLSLAEWNTANASIWTEMTSLIAFGTQQSAPGEDLRTGNQVPIKVRFERFVQFSNTFNFGRAADQLVGLVKDDCEVVTNVYEDYNSSAPPHPSTSGLSDADKGHVESHGAKFLLVVDCEVVINVYEDNNSIAPPHPLTSELSGADKGHVEPRGAKFLLVAFVFVMFAFICYSFFPLPFTFNTVVAYATVVALKQLIVALKNYQSLESARRLFTNMSAFNIWAVLLVSVPVTEKGDILASPGHMAALTLAMIFASVYLTEPVVFVLEFVSKTISSCCCQRRKTRQNREISLVESKTSSKSLVNPNTCGNTGWTLHRRRPCDFTPEPCNRESPCLGPTFFLHGSKNTLARPLPSGEPLSSETSMSSEREQWSGSESAAEVNSAPTGILEKCSPRNCQLMKGFEGSQE